MGRQIMTDNCIEFSEKLQDFLKSPFCNAVTTENFIYTWIALDDAIDVYSVLMSMMHNHEKRYSDDVIKKLEDLKKDIDSQRNV